MTDDTTNTRLTMAILTEAGILAQLSRAWIEAASPDGLSMPQFTVLLHLSRMGVKQTPLQLAHAFQLPKTTVTHTVATLEKKGFITLEPNPEDGRSKLVVLTTSGANAMQGTMETVGGVVAGLVGDLNSDDLGQTLDQISQLRERFDRNRPD
ncbi:MAG: MarR family winged helix-turn-helix transcriptional regulator [Pseudooceanicola sp.]